MGVTLNKKSTTTTTTSMWSQGSNEQMQKQGKHKTEIAQMLHKRISTLELSVKYFTRGL